MKLSALLLCVALVGCRHNVNVPAKTTELCARPHGAGLQVCPKKN